MCRSATWPSVDILGRINSGRFAYAMQFRQVSLRFDRRPSQRGRGQFAEDGTIGHGETSKLREFAASRTPRPRSAPSAQCGRGSASPSTTGCFTARAAGPSSASPPTAPPLRACRAEHSVCCRAVPTRTGGRALRRALCPNGALRRTGPRRRSISTS
jgi:hypothetical protein